MKVTDDMSPDEVSSLMMKALSSWVTAQRRVVLVAFGDADREKENLVIQQVGRPEMIAPTLIATIEQMPPMVKLQMAAQLDHEPLGSMGTPDAKVSKLFTDSETAEAFIAEGKTTRQQAIDDEFDGLSDAEFDIPEQEVN
jgi:hypothetical protein